MPETPIRYALGIEVNGVRWLAADLYQAGPQRTHERHRAMTWESPGTLQAWLDGIPDYTDINGKSYPVAAAWMPGAKLFVVPIVLTAGEPTPLAAREFPMLEGSIK